MTTIQTIFLCLFLCFGKDHYELLAQNGYVITEDNRLIKGFIRSTIDFETKEKIVEIYSSKVDKEPKRIYLYKEIKEYANKKDTFRIVKDLHTTIRAPRPFAKKETSRFIDFLVLKAIKKGRLILYSANIEMEPYLSNNFDGKDWYTRSSLRAVHHYVIEDEEETFTILYRENYREILRELIELDSFNHELKNEKFKYKKLPDLIERYNRAKLP